MFLLLGGIFDLLLVATILVGQNIGAGNLLEAKRVVGTSANFFATLAAVMSGAGWLLSERLLEDGSDARSAGARLLQIRRLAHSTHGACRRGTSSLELRT